MKSHVSDGANSEVAALRSGKVNLALHAVIARHVPAEERSDVVAAVAEYAVPTKELEALFVALGWRKLMDLGEDHRRQRLLLLAWACGVLHELPASSPKNRLRQLAMALPVKFVAGAGSQLSLAAK